MSLYPIEQPAIGGVGEGEKGGVVQLLGDRDATSSLAVT